MRRLMVWVLLIVSVVVLASCNKGGAEKPDFKGIAEGVVDSLAAGDFNAVTDKFDAAMKSSLSAGQLETAWKLLASQAGEFKEKAGTEELKQDGLDVVIVNCRMENASISVKVVFNSDGTIGGLWIQPGQ